MFNQDHVLKFTTTALGFAPFVCAVLHPADEGGRCTRPLPLLIYLQSDWNLRAWVRPHHSLNRDTTGRVPRRYRNSGSPLADVGTLRAR